MTTGNEQPAGRPARRKRRWYGVVGVVCLAVVVCLVWTRSQAEPRVEGKPLSQWLFAGNTDDFEALARIGPEVIPDLEAAMRRGLWTRQAALAAMEAIQAAGNGDSKSAEPAE